MGIKGIPIPHGAPNANAFVERFNLSLRREALDHFIFMNEGHVRRVCREYVEFYNRARPSQATEAIPDPYPELSKQQRKGGKVIALPVLGGVAARLSPRGVASSRWMFRVDAIGPSPRSIPPVADGRGLRVRVGDVPDPASVAPAP